MKYLSRLLIASVSGLFFAGGAALAATPQHSAPAQSTPAAQNHSSWGYLGIVCNDVDSKRAGELKLKEATGTEIVNVDRDGPAGKSGLRPHDVILQMNGQTIADEQQLRRMLHETPAGRTINLLISRDGQQKTISVTLADRATVEEDAWTQHVIIPPPDDEGQSPWGGSTGHTFGSGFFSVFSFGTPSVGLELDTLGTQLADYFGIRDGQGLLVKRVAENSPASRAGLKAGDVITKANGKKMATLGEWMKMLHANRGKLIQLTLIRNRKEQTTTLQAGGKKSHSELVAPEGLNVVDNLELAKTGPYLAPQLLTPSGPGSIDLQTLLAQLKKQDAWMESQMRQMEFEIESMGAPSID